MQLFSLRSLMVATAFVQPTPLIIAQVPPLFILKQLKQAFTYKVIDHDYWQAKEKQAKKVIKKYHRKQKWNPQS